VVFRLGKSVGRGGHTQGEGQPDGGPREAMAVSVHAAKVAARLPTVVSRRATSLSLHADPLSVDGELADGDGAPLNPSVHTAATSLVAGDRVRLDGVCVGVRGRANNV
jgi:hypothetical protein